MGFKNAEMFTQIEEHELFISISMKVGDFDNFIFGSDIATRLQQVERKFHNLIDEIWYQFTIVTPEESGNSFYTLTMDFQIDLSEQSQSVDLLIKEIDELYPKWFQGK